MGYKLSHFRFLPTILERVGIDINEKYVGISNKRGLKELNKLLIIC